MVNNSPKAVEEGVFGFSNAKVRFDGEGANSANSREDGAKNEAKSLWNKIEKKTQNK